MTNDLKSNIQVSVKCLNPIRVRGAKKQGFCFSDWLEEAPSMDHDQ
jgi:hypothetical protein